MIDYVNLKGELEIMGIVIIICLILLVLWAIKNPIAFLIVLFVLIVIGVLIFESEKKNSEENQKRREEEKKKKNDEYVRLTEVFEEKKKQYAVPENCLTINYKKGLSNISKGKQYVWSDGSDLSFFPAVVLPNEADYIVFKIPIENLEYYTTQGDIFTNTRVSGGGGEIGGSSVGGAVIGGFIAGGTGAIIGSRKKGKINPVKSEIVTNDNRETILKYYVGEVKKTIFFDYDDYITLLKIIPQKEYSNFISNQLERGERLLAISQLKELAELKERGILTEEEFLKKKEVLLEQV